MSTMSWVKYNTIDLYVYHRGAVCLVSKERDDAVGDTSALVYYREVLGLEKSATDQRAWRLGASL